jgi:tetratricopeptide (TPR) repeat protein
MRGLLIVLILAHAAVAEEPDEEIARRHFEQGRVRYAAGDYNGALQEFLAARKVHPAAALDYNIARCYDRLERAAEAISEYQQYLLSDATSADAAEVRARIDILKSRIHPSTAPPLAQPSSGEGGSSLRIAGITIGALGLACLVAGIATGVLAQQAGSDLSRLDQTRPRVEFDPGKESEGKTDQVLEGVFLGVGAAAVATAAVLYGLGHRARHPKQAFLQGGGLCVRF